MMATSEIVLADKEVQAQIQTIVDSAPARAKGGAMCSAMAAANLERLRGDFEDGGCSPYGPPGTPATGLGWDSSTEPKNREDMTALAIKLNPSVGFWDPLGIVGDKTAPETVGWFRHAEIKHGRVAMAAFVGYCVQSNGIHFPWNLQASISGVADVPTISFGDIAAAGGPADQWDALPSAAKVQILGVIGFLEMWSETSMVLKADGEAHYVRGGKPGYFPKLSRTDELAFPHPVPLNLWDPFGFTKKMTPEKKEKALLAEINNGRLAMIGIFGLISASKGLQVPGLDNIAGIKPYAGQYMAPFVAADNLPFVSDMSSYSLPF